MSFAFRKDVVEMEDTVILYLGINKMHALQVVPQIKNKHGNLVENIFQTTYGSLKVQSLVGQRFGSKVNLSRGWGYLLYPTPELWTVTLPHRTQILYFHDISLIILQLELRPGSVVIESGTGSGSLSHALIRSVKPKGHLHTFDFHASRVEIAKCEFENHGLKEFVTINQRDVINNGFGDHLEGKADAVFLDLPKPWEVVRHSVKVMKPTGGRFISFSPCIEQVQRTAELLAKEGFVDISTTECLQKELQVTSKNLPILDLECLNTKKQEPGIKHPTTNNDPKFKTHDREQTSILTALPTPTVPGHTGYLTAATLPPLWARRTKRRKHDTRNEQMDLIVTNRLRLNNSN